MPSKICQKCGKPYRGARCPACAPAAPARKHGTRSKAVEGARKAANPWRVDYGRAAYRKARQEAIRRSGGACAICGTACAYREHGIWRALPTGGVHHIRALSEGGGNDAGNLVLLCVKCHNRVDAERRKRAFGS